MWKIVLATLLFASLAARADDAFYGAAPGSFAIVTIESLLLDDAELGRPLDLRIVYPASGGPFPLIVFSHGTFSSNDVYGPVAEHWASHGYAVILPNHIDAHRGVTPQGEDGMRDIIQSRARDLSRVLDRLDDIEKRAPALAGKIDRAHFVAAGHSVGSYVAMLTTGLRTRQPNTGAVDSFEESRFGAVVMLSDPGKMALQPEDLWKGSVVPTFLATGTEDYGLMGKGNRPTTYTMERLSGIDAQAGSKFFLLIDKADHYFGGLIHRPVEGKTPDAEGLAIFNGASVAFLDWITKGNETAHRALVQSDWPGVTNGRATLTVE